MASVLFMRIGSVHHHTPNVLDECAKCFRTMQATIAKYSGMMARFNVDDKGTIMLAAFGPPPAQHEDDAVRAVRVRLRSSPNPDPNPNPNPHQVRAVRCGLDIVEKLERAGHDVRVGITTGNVYAGSVGNGQRCECTFSSPNPRPSPDPSR